jgi:hypothetical protein
MIMWSSLIRSYRTLSCAPILFVLVATATTASAQIAVVTSTVEEHVAAPGERYSGTIVVRNLTNKEQPVRIYQSDYRFFADGTSRFDAPATTPRSNAKWITPTVRSLLIPAASEMTVTYSVAVPQSDSLTGTYWSMVMVEGAATEARRSSGGAPQVGVGAIMRYAIQVATHIATTGSRKVSFSKSRFLTNPDSSQSLELEVENVGERAYRPALWIEIYDEQGTLQTNARQERGLLYPGTSLKQTFALGKLRRGSYRAIVFADSGEDAVFASQFTLKY